MRASDKDLPVTWYAVDFLKSYTYNCLLNNCGNFLIRLFFPKDWPFFLKTYSQKLTNLKPLSSRGGLWNYDIVAIPMKTRGTSILMKTYLPVWGFSLRLTVSTSPNFSKYSFNWASRVSQLSPPTKIFLSSEGFSSYGKKKYLWKLFIFRKISNIRDIIWYEVFKLSVECSDLLVKYFMGLPIEYF